jgi:hypothetical protein
MTWALHCRPLWPSERVRFLDLRRKPPGNGAHPGAPVAAAAQAASSSAISSMGLRNPRRLRGRCSSGARFPGELVEECARRELEEETGRRLSIRLVITDSICPVFIAEPTADASVYLSDEHDAFRWTTLVEALTLIRPVQVARTFECAPSRTAR